MAKLEVKKAAGSATSEDADAGTKRRLFLAAEALVAERGFEAVSSRDITAAADVNVAAINYYYGSKNKLLFEIFKARASELNRERAALLNAAIAKNPKDAKGILRAFIEPPTLWISDERKTALRFLNRSRSEGPQEIRDVILKDVRHLKLFADALINALPHLERAEVLWRLHFTQGVLHHNSAADYARLDLLSGGLCTPDDRQALLDRLCCFIAAGFGVSAPSQL
jgi:AcrR family transcriptional regulator